MLLRVTADDFGYSASINRAIVAAFQARIITHCSIMANMPGFEDACRLMETAELGGSVGLHLNLSEGTPLTGPILKMRRFCSPMGQFVGRRTNITWLSGEERAAIVEELQAQFDRCISRTQLLSHIDSHHHFHTEWAILPLVMSLAKRNRLKHIRLSRNCGRPVPLYKLVYKGIINTRLRLAGLTQTRWFGLLSDAQTLRRLGHGALEVMVHPCFAKDGSLLDATENRPLTLRSIEELGRNHRPG